MNRPLVVCVIALLAGCSTRIRAIPSANPEWAKADYTVLGRTNDEECGTYILAIDWAHLFRHERARIPQGSLLGALSGRLLPEESRALYHALEKMPEATHLLAHRSHTTSTGLLIGTRPIFGERCTAVEARGVKIGERPAGFPDHDPA